MKRLIRNTGGRYALAIGIFAASLLMQWAIRHAFSLNPTPLILIAVVASGWYAGTGPSIVTALLWSFVANLYVPGHHSMFAVHLNDSDLPRFVILILIALLAGRLRRATLIRKLRAEQQAAVARLSQRALQGTEIDELMNETARVITQTLGLGHCAMLEYLADQHVFVMRTGVGWRDIEPESVRVNVDENSMAAHALRTNEPVITNNLSKETRFRPHPHVLAHRIRSSLAVVIHGEPQPFGILTLHATNKNRFTRDDIDFAQSIANVLSMAIARKQAETHLQNQQQWLESVLNLMPTPMLLIEPITARVTFANRAADEMAGGEFPRGKSAEEYHTVYYGTDAEGRRIPNTEMPGVRAARGERLNGYQMDWQTPGGKRSIIVFSDRMPAMHGQPATVVQVFQDITRLKLIEAELQTANRLKDEFLATVSHELRTPLNAILGWSRMLRSGKLDEQVSARALETIERNGLSQAQIIDDLLDASRIITGKLRLEVGAVDLAPIIEAALDSIRPAIDAKGLRLRVQLDTEAGPVLGDTNRLQQIIWNLLSNAVKFTPNGGEIEVVVARTETNAEITVRDSGQGISAEFLPYVFDRFRQADSSMTRKHQGLGLGLAIVRQLVEMHGGTVTAASAGEGRGAIFVVRLPMMKAADALGVAHYRAVASLPGDYQVAETDASLRGLRLLIVDDDDDARELLATLLEQSGARVTTAAAADEALQALGRFDFDALVSDIEMPGEDGYTLIRKVRQLESERGSHLPAIALTAHARLEDRHKAIAAGFEFHLAKPFDPAELAGILAGLRKVASGRA